MQGEPPPGWPPAGAGMQGVPGMAGLDIESIRRSLRRRVTLLLVGLAVVIVGLQIDPLALGWPLWSRTVAWIVGLAVAMIGALGLTTGVGCLAQLLLVVLLGALLCNATATSHPGTHVLAGVTLASMIVGMILRRRARARAMSMQPTFTERGVEPGSSGAATPSRGGSIIDVDAHDKS